MTSSFHVKPPVEFSAADIALARDRADFAAALAERRFDDAAKAFYGMGGFAGDSVDFAAGLAMGGTVGDFAAFMAAVEAAAGAD